MRPALIHQDHAIQRHIENGVGARLAAPGVHLRLLSRASLLFERRGAIGGLAHFGHAATAGDDQEDVLENHPRRMLDPAPLAGHHNPVHRLRPEDSAQHVIERDDNRRRNQHAPVAIEREERKRAEDVEMGFDAPACQVDEQRAHQHLGGRNRVARRRPAGPEQREQRGKQTDQAAEDDRCPDVKVRAARRAGPRERRDPEGEDDAANPLEAHQAGEQAIGVPIDVVLIRREELAAARRCSGFHQCCFRFVCTHGFPLCDSDAWRKQWTAEHVRGWAGRRPAIQEGDDRAPPIVIAAVRARTGDAAGKEQVSRLCRTAASALMSMHRNGAPLGRSRRERRWCREGSRPSATSRFGASPR